MIAKAALIWFLSATEGLLITFIMCDLRAAVLLGYAVGTKFLQKKRGRAARNNLKPPQSDCFSPTLQVFLSSPLATGTGLVHHEKHGVVCGGSSQTGQLADHSVARDHSQVVQHKNPKICPRTCFRPAGLPTRRSVLQPPCPCVAMQCKKTLQAPKALSPKPPSSPRSEQTTKPLFQVLDLKILGKRSWEVFSAWGWEGGGQLHTMQLLESHSVPLSLDSAHT